MEVEVAAVKVTVRDPSPVELERDRERVHRAAPPRLRVEAESKGGGRKVATTTDDDGRFVLSELGPGVHALAHRAPNGAQASDPLRCAAGARDVVFSGSAISGQTATNRLVPCPSCQTIGRIRRVRYR